jgi:queuine tRNA-ribosyltransferase
MKVLQTNHGPLRLPVFLPDATRGIVRAVDTADVEEAKIEALVVNTLHLASKPGTSTLSTHGGIHQFMDWKGPIISDSGGFQLFSMINESKMGSINPKGFIYQHEKGGKKHKLTPEKCIQLQFKIGADIIYCLDYCTHPDMDMATQKTSVEYTINWAKKCKKEYDRLLAEKKDPSNRPLLFGVVQGGNSKELRKKCAEALLEIGFDGFGYGGWPIDKNGKLLDMVGYVADLLPKELPKHALGIGKPENLVAAYEAGYHIFDCVIPTRDARHKRLYAYNEPITSYEQLKGDFYSYLYIQDEKYIKDSRPIDEVCDCLTNERYSRSYLTHLFSINDHLAYRLATIHNLRFYSKLQEYLRELGPVV